MVLVQTPQDHQQVPVGLPSTSHPQTMASQQLGLQDPLLIPLLREAEIIFKWVLKNKMALNKMSKTISAVNTQIICLKNHIVGKLGRLGRPPFESFLAKNLILALLNN